jgi:environmental stress-induced protein Ves
MRVLRAADRIAMPWKNGGGVTREVSAYPPGADMDSFEWRISLARDRRRRTVLDLTGRGSRADGD